MVAEEAPHPQADDDWSTGPGQIADGTDVVRMDALRPPLAAGTLRSLTGRGGDQGDVLVGDQEGFHVDGAKVREE